VEQFLCLGAVGLIRGILYIALLDGRIVVGFAARHSRPLCRDLWRGHAHPVGGRIGLSATAHAASAACHHFDEVVGRFFAFLLGGADFVEQFYSRCRVRKPQPMRMVPCPAFILPFLMPSEPRTKSDIGIGQFLSRAKVISCAQSGFHHTAGGSEDGSRAGVFTQRVVRNAVRQMSQVDARGS
jgi:hypothetical protein